MSENHGQKDYSSYFEALEQQLNSPPNRRDQSETAVSQNRTEKIKRKGIYGVFRLRKSVLAVIAVALIVVIVLAVSSFKGVTVDSKQLNVPQNNSIAVEDNTAQKEQQKLKITYEFTDETVAIPTANDAKNVIIIDKTTKKVVAERNARERAFPASTTKIMTLLVAVENMTDLNDSFVMTYEITDPLFVEGASVAGFLDGETVSMTDLLYGTILPSGADAATALAIKICGNEKQFVKLMNEKVEELGLKNTHFDNVTGLHSENNYSTAYDMAVILDAALQNETCKKVLSTYQHTTAKTQQNPNGILLSSTLFTHMYGTEPETATILGGKTGFVNESGYCIASYGKANQTENEYIVVTLGNSSKWPAFYGQIDLYKEFVK